MAEARLAVAFSFNVTHDGFTVDYDAELVRELLHTAKRSWRYRFIRFWNQIKNNVFPFTLHSVAALIIMTTSLTVTEYWDPTFGLARKLAASLPWKLVKDYPKESLVASTFALSAAGWSVVVFMVRWSIQMLLSYRGALYERRGKNSWKTKAWFILLKILAFNRNPQLYSYQSMMPLLPLPKLEDTMKRYLRSVRPLLNDVEYERMSRLALEFEKGIGRKFQRYLFLKWLVSTNYVSDWWEEYVYLRSRAPIMVNSNFYALDAVYYKGTTIQAARAANLIFALLTFRRMIEREEVTPLIIEGSVPLDSWQYIRTFDTTRVPGVDTDKIKHFPVSATYVVVWNKGRFYKVPTHSKGRLLNPRELELQMERILNDNSPAQPGEEYLAALTAGERRHWAEARTDFFSRGVNRVSLETIERAAFFVTLDDVEYEYNPDDKTQLDSYAKWMLHGDGRNRWYDKSFNLVVMKNAKIGMNVEHSWADAPVMGHAFEWAVAEDLASLGYDEKGHTVGKIETLPLNPQRLQFELNAEAQKAIQQSYTVARNLCDDVDLVVLMFTEFGKGLMKKCKVSPDAFLQMTLQLAYRRDQGKFSLTYEASMTRLYREGRTETVRACTVESCAFVDAMLDPNVSNVERIRLLKIACENHQSGYLNSMCGKGIDRHLFCLYVVSRYLEIDTPFLKEVLSEPWKLSTSQTPQNQTGRIDVTKNPEHIAAGGGFGPVADDGYGVSYIVAGENALFFHISSKKSSPVTDSNRFRERIREALHDMRALFDSTPI